MILTLSGFSRVLCVAGALLVTPLAFAHAHLKAQIPAANAEVTPPQVLMLNFSEGIEPKFSGLTLTDAAKQTVKTGTVSRSKEDNAQLVVPVEQELQPGNYTVDWHVVSVDGHKTRGTYSFTVK